MDLYLTGRRIGRLSFLFSSVDWRLRQAGSFQGRHKRVELQELVGKGESLSRNPIVSGRGQMCWQLFSLIMSKPPVPVDNLRDS